MDLCCSTCLPTPSRMDYRQETPMEGQLPGPGGQIGFHTGPDNYSSFTSPVSPTFPQGYPYGQPYQRANGYNIYPQSSSTIMSPMQSPAPYPSYQPYAQQHQYRHYEQERRMIRDSAPAHLHNNMLPMQPSYPTTPLPYNGQLQFLAQNPQYLSGLAGQHLGSAAKVSRAIAAQIFAKDENTDRFPCSLCGQSFKRINGLKRHLMMHLQIKPYKCDMCHRGFCRIDVFKRHVARDKCVKDH